MQRETAFSRTREEVLSNLDSLIMRKLSDAVFSEKLAKVYNYGNENSENKFM
ncbi:hypothetical protein [Metabacillus fastidiosus]|uniref:hypothetical protein n=1 Tax=Metabacillus fastidiosus TaxID=1458 RepID=UPI002E1E22D1|nr:hypothetical protein [Metabacillus fastidiosus]